MGDALTAVVKARFEGEQMPISMRTSMMVFGSKPKKPNSLKPGDKRRISPLNCEAKGVEAKKFTKIIKTRMWYSRHRLYH